MSVIIGLSGKAKSGKNSVVHLSRIAVDDYKDPPEKIRSVAFADPLKEMAHKMVDEGHPLAFGVTHDDIENKTPAGRKFLQDLGMMKRKEDPLYWVKLAEKKVIQVAADPRVKVLYVPDVRFRNEADFVKSKGWLLWRVRRPVIEPFQAKDQHASEMELDTYDGFDSFLVCNNMTELFERVKLQLNWLGLL